MTDGLKKTKITKNSTVVVKDPLFFIEQSYYYSEFLKMNCTHLNNGPITEKLSLSEDLNQPLSLRRLTQIVHQLMNKEMEQRLPT